MFKLGINTGFAVNRYSEPSEWARIIGEECDLRSAQLTADLINPALGDKIIAQQIQAIQTACTRYRVQVTSTFTGAFSRLNHLAHPDRDIQQYWIDWFKRFVDITQELGSTNMGSHFGIFTSKDDNDPVRRAERRQQNIENWHCIAQYAAQKGLEYLTWEPMSISREQGETQAEVQRLQKDVNHQTPLPFLLCLDVDHGDVTSTRPEDTDPYAWLMRFGKESPIIHLKQSTRDKSGHFPFTQHYNAQGKIQPARVIHALQESGRTHADLILELSFRERNPIDQQVIPILKESVHYWKQGAAESLE